MKKRKEDRAHSSNVEAQNAGRFGVKKRDNGPPIPFSIVKDGESCDFCMCNPPFFEKMEETGLNPKTSCGGTPDEMMSLLLGTIIRKDPLLTSDETGKAISYTAEKSKLPSDAMPDIQQLETIANHFLKVLLKMKHNGSNDPRLCLLIVLDGVTDGKNCGQGTNSGRPFKKKCRYTCCIYYIFPLRA
ncbi:hypothetical protein ACS0TY_035341 [Phlomoides rotata]